MCTERFPLVAVVHFVDIPYRIRTFVHPGSLVLCKGTAKDEPVDVRIWVRSGDWDGGLAGDVSLRQLSGDGRILAEGRPSALSLFFDSLEHHGRRVSD